MTSIQYVSAGQSSLGQKGESCSPVGILPVFTVGKENVPCLEGYNRVGTFFVKLAVSRRSPQQHAVGLSTEFVLLMLD